MSETIIHVQKLAKSYRMGPAEVKVLRGLSLTVERGEFLAVVGSSGSGKSTLLHLVGLLDEPDAGSIVLDGREMTTLSARQRVRMRRQDIGFVFQFYHLLPELNVLQNVQIAQMTGTSTLDWLLGGRVQARAQAVELLELMGLGERLKHRPGELSGGERQRVAIARALVNRPQLLLADEPTGNLDRRTGEAILQVLRDFHTRHGQTTVMVTHDPALAEQADRIVHLQDGRLK